LGRAVGRGYALDMGEVSRGDRRAAGLRRAWRLALLFSGDVERAREVHTAVGLRAKVEAIEAYRLDRLVVLEHRERRGPRRRVSRDRGDGVGAASSASEAAGAVGASAGEGSARGLIDAAWAYEALEALSPQGREAWLLRRVEGMEEIAAARAMDCSKTALGHHLRHAERSMEEAGLDGEGLRRSIVGWLEATAPHPPAEPRAARRRRRLRRAAWAVGIAAAAAAIVAAWAAWG